MGKIRFAVLMLWFSFVMSITGFAGIDYKMDDSPSFDKTITWSSSEGDAEYRYLSGTASSDSYEAALPAGSGGSASITVQDNGVYTLFAKSGTVIQAVSVPVVTIDRTGPDISLIGVSRNTDGSVDVSYSVSDYFSVADTRIASGKQTASGFHTASSIGGGIIYGLKPGVYTLFGKDVAGNISIYPLIVDADAKEWSTQYSEKEEWSTEWSTEWGSNWLHYEYDNPFVVLISKCDVTNGKELKGAHMEIIDMDENLLIEWITNGEQTQIKSILEPGNSYILKERIAPDGYEIAESIVFTVKDDGSITHVVMYDRPKNKPENPNIETITPATGQTVNQNPQVPKAPLEEFPQTGGLIEERVGWVACGVIFVLAGSGCLLYIRRQNMVQ